MIIFANIDKTDIGRVAYTEACGIFNLNGNDGIIRLRIAISLHLSVLTRTSAEHRGNHQQEDIFLHFYIDFLFLTAKLQNISDNDKNYH